MLYPTKYLQAFVTTPISQWTPVVHQGARPVSPVHSKDWTLILEMLTFLAVPIHLSGPYPSVDGSINCLFREKNEHVEGMDGVVRKEVGQVGALVCGVAFGNRALRKTKNERGATYSWIWSQMIFCKLLSLIYHPKADGTGSSCNNALQNQLVHRFDNVKPLREQPHPAGILNPFSAVPNTSSTECFYASSHVNIHLCCGTGVNYTSVVKIHYCTR